MEFYSSYNRPPSKAKKDFPLDDINYIYNDQTDDIEAVGTDPFYERIQSYHDSCKLSCKLAKFAMGDTSSLGSDTGAYGDFTEMPTDLRSILDQRKKVQDDFNNLDSSIRAIFNNDFAQFEAAVRDGTIGKRLSEGLKSSEGAGASGVPVSAPGANTSNQGGNG